ncbi:MAG: ATP-binding cassette domain-containing protein [Oscillospiraceae bacterium]|nr:ATP-binding cassette domain-containing protein [Oscillospiraceae bacterium]
MQQTEYIIEVTNLEKSFKDLRVLKGVNLRVKKGSIFALLGSNGAGKTTAVRILSTLSRADGGRATICGHDVVRQADAVRGCISLTGQYAAVDEILTGRENLRLIGLLCHLPNAKQRADELLEAFRLEDAADRRASTYSGGMRRRLDIAMGLVGKPEVIFLDEPTTGLDPQSRLAMWETVRGLADSGITIFLTTQYLDEAEYLADHIAILHEGIITAEGTPDELKAVLPQGSIQLDFRNRADVERARAALSGYRICKSTGEAGGGNGEVVENAIDVSTDGSAAQFADVLIRLDKEGIPLARFTQKQPSLEEVFLTTIGEKQ